MVAFTDAALTGSRGGSKNQQAPSRSSGASAASASSSIVRTKAAVVSALILYSATAAAGGTDAFVPPSFLAGVNTPPPQRAHGVGFVFPKTISRTAAFGYLDSLGAAEPKPSAFASGSGSGSLIGAGYLDSMVPSSPGASAAPAPPAAAPATLASASASSGPASYLDAITESCDAFDGPSPSSECGTTIASYLDTLSTSALRVSKEAPTYLDTVSTAAVSRAVSAPPARHFPIRCHCRRSSIWPTCDRKHNCLN